MTRIKEKTKEYWDRFIEHVERRHPVYVAFSGIAVAAFTLALFIATWLLWTAGEKHSERQLRAYVGIGAPHFGERDPRELTITVQNGGQTPAYKVWVHLNRYRVPFGQKLPANFGYPDYNPGDKRSAAVVQSGKEITFTFEFDPNELARVRNQETALFLYGHVDYIDVFDKNRSSQFSYQYLPVMKDGKDIGHQLIFQSEHNDAN
jgi:hypothetical protein